MCAQIEYIILAYGGYKLEKKMMRGRKVYYQNNLVIGTKLLNYALQLVLDYDDLMRIPVVNDVIRKSVDEAVKVRYVSTFSCQHACSHRIYAYYLYLIYLNFYFPNPSRFNEYYILLNPSDCVFSILTIAAFWPSNCRKL